MNTSRIVVARALAIKMAYSLVRVAQMSLFDACRIAAKRHQVDADWLYRAMTE